MMLFMSLSPFYRVIGSPLRQPPPALSSETSRANGPGGQGVGTIACQASFMVSAVLSTLSFTFSATLAAVSFTFPTT